jgi:hypothetical protein
MSVRGEPSLPADRAIPNSTASAAWPRAVPSPRAPSRPRAGPARPVCPPGVPGRGYDLARRARSLLMTGSGTSPLTSPPYSAISLTRLELRNEYSGLVVMNSVSTFAMR